MKNLIITDSTDKASQNFFLRNALLIDVVGDKRQLGLWQKGKLLHRCQDNAALGHIEHLPALLDRLTISAAFDFSLTDLIAVTTGPGGYASIRAGLAFAHGLGLAWQKPVVGISILAIFAEEAFATHDVQHCLSIHDAKRGECMSAHYSATENLFSKNAVRQNYESARHYLRENCSAESMDEKNCEWAVIGSGANAIGEGPWHIMERFNADLEAFGRCVGKITDPGLLRPKPLYVRPPDAIPSAAMKLHH